MSKEIKTRVTFLDANGKPTSVKVKGSYEALVRLYNIVYEGENVIWTQERSAEPS